MRLYHSAGYKSSIMYNLDFRQFVVSKKRF